MFECTVDIDPRRELRFVPKRFCFVKMDNGSKSVLGEIVDISLAGLAFRYIPGLDQGTLLPVPEKAYTLHLFQSGFYSPLPELKACVAYDAPQNNVISFLDMPPRQCGLSFLELNQNQKNMLRLFIDSAKC